MFRILTIAAVAAGLSVSALAQPPIPDTEMVLTPPPAGKVKGAPELDERTNEYLEKFAYCYADFRIHIDVTMDDLKSYLEFDLYQGPS